MSSSFWTALTVVLLLGATTADAASPGHCASRISGARDGAPAGSLGPFRQSLQPTPGEIRGLGSRFPEIGVAPGAPGGPTYYPKAMRPVEPE
jgi:hypothetical protein